MLRRTYSKSPAVAFAFTLVELLVVLGVLALLAAVLLPVFLQARAKAASAACVSNLRQLGLAMTMYAADADGHFPTHVEEGKGPLPDWDAQLLPYVKNTEMFHCPACPVPNLAADYISKGYALNSNISGVLDGSRPSVTDAAVRFPASTISLCEVAFISGPNWVKVAMATDGPEDGKGVEKYVGSAGGLRHQGGSNYGFADGHVHWYKPWQVNAGNVTVNGVAVRNTGNSPSFGL